MGQGRGGLVHDENAGVASDRLEDLEHLDVRDREVFEKRRRLVGQVLACQQRQRGAPDLSPVNAAQAVERLDTQEERLLDGHLRDEVQLLEDHGDPVAAGLGRVRQDHPLPVDADLALVGLVHAVDDLDQCGFASAVLAADHMHRPAHKRQAHVAQGLYAWEGLLDPAKLEQRLLCQPSSAVWGA